MNKEKFPRGKRSVEEKRGEDLAGVWLAGADLKGVDLTGVDISNAFLDKWADN